MKIANAIYDSNGSNSWTLRLITLLVWAALGLCVAYWAFKFVTTKPVEATAAVATPAVVVDTKAIAKLLGATDNIAVKPVITPASVKLTLFGLATTRSGQGVALIATEDKPAKPYRVGAKVTDELVLKSISKVDAVLAASASAPDGQKLSLPERKPATSLSSLRPNPGDRLPLPSPAVSANGAANPAFMRGVAQPPPPAMPSVSAFTDPQRGAAISRFAPRAPDGAAVGAAVQNAPDQNPPAQIPPAPNAAVPGRVNAPDSANALIPGPNNQGNLKY